MILLEQHITISIYHQHILKHFDVVEMLTDTGVLSFKVMKYDEYYFTLMGKNENNAFKLWLSDADDELSIDNELLSKIKISLYSVFLNGRAS